MKHIQNGDKTTLIEKYYHYFIYLLFVNIVYLYSFDLSLLNRLFFMVINTHLLWQQLKALFK